MPLCKTLSFYLLSVFTHLFGWKVISVFHILDVCLSPASSPRTSDLIGYLRIKHERRSSKDRQQPLISGVLHEYQPLKRSWRQEQRDANKPTKAALRFIEIPECFPIIQDFPLSWLSIQSADTNFRGANDEVSRSICNFEVNCH